METWQVSLISLVAGFFLAAVPQWFDRRRNVVAYWKALREEIEYCHKIAIGLVPAGVAGGLRRLPTAIYKEAFPRIVAQGEVEELEVAAILLYYDFVQQVNASLDITGAALERNDQPRAIQEFGRMALKAQRFEAGHGEHIYDNAIAIANQHCSKGWWRY